VRITCPMCKKVIEDAPDDHAPRPFCSARCKLADLHNWLGGAYRISTPLETSALDETDPSASS
jgi:uncharacterized protein